MAKRFNPPPHWPQPPDNWVPPHDWRPDPAWGPAPEGWQLWVDPDEPAQPAAPSRKEKRIFISYRRSDCQPQANAINDGLRHRLHPARVFMDIDSIPVGVDFEEHIRHEIEICDVVLVIIGDDWLSATNEAGTRRIDDPDDFVRLEIESALASSRVSLVPILVEGAEMPRSAELPENIRGLARINAIELSDQRWTSDIERLAGVIRDLQLEQEAKATMATAATQPPAPTPVPPRTDAPAPQPGQIRPMPGPSPPAPPTESAGMRAVGWIMVAVPLFTCGLLSFVPSAWVAYMRREDRKLMTRSVLFSGLFLVTLIGGFVLVGSAPKNAEGSPEGVRGTLGAIVVVLNVVGAMGLALIQHNPTAALEDRRRA